MLKAHVAIVYFKCFKSFIGMLQVLYIDVANIDRDVAHVIMAIHVCFNVSSTSDECCNCFIWMLYE
jgi:hypothetical protein